MTASVLWTELFAQLRQQFSALNTLVEVMDHNSGMEEYMVVIKTCEVVAVQTHLFPPLQVNHSQLVRNRETPTKFNESIMAIN